MVITIFIFSALVFIALILLKINRLALLRLLILYLVGVCVFAIYIIFDLVKTNTPLEGILPLLPYILFPLIMPIASIFLLLWKKSTRLLLWFLIIYQVVLWASIYGVLSVLKKMG